MLDIHNKNEQYCSEEGAGNRLSRHSKNGKFILNRKLTIDFVVMNDVIHETEMVTRRWRNSRRRPHECNAGDKMLNLWVNNQYGSQECHRGQELLKRWFNKRCLSQKRIYCKQTLKTTKQCQVSLSEWNVKERQCLNNRCCKQEGNDGYRCRS